MLLLSHIGTVLLSLNVLLYCFFAKRNTKQLILFRIYLIGIFSVQLLSLILFFYKKNNILFSHLYFVWQFTLLSLFYTHLISGKLLQKIIYTLLVIVPIILIIQYILNPDLFFQINATEAIMCSIPLISYAIIYWYQSLDKANTKWLIISSGIITYLITSTIVFSGNDIAVTYFKAMGIQKKIWIANNIMFIVYHLLIGAEWFKSFRKKYD